eukprot:gnl/MRDRNA2_/MRDRNA2_65187_c0_seq1.p1 gnl/MRDRNA2_/MRDRNA2_65187_c0~~gnl/MRDRNA2_/MRDRNA2_65187_c0_seq1.p1  ORF type:complete len:936 (-),score=166.48 gnl/MRDRNA2_/MRDRNA2_65187_c0_seq1:102-2909(-)
MTSSVTNSELKGWPPDHAHTSETAPQAYDHHALVDELQSIREESLSFSQVLENELKRLQQIVESNAKQAAERLSAFETHLQSVSMSEHLGIVADQRKFEVNGAKSASAKITAGVSDQFKVPSIDNSQEIKPQPSSEAPGKNLALSEPVVQEKDIASCALSDETTEPTRFLSKGSNSSDSSAFTDKNGNVVDDVIAQLLTVGARRRSSAAMTQSLGDILADDEDNYRSSSYFTFEKVVVIHPGCRALQVWMMLTMSFVMYEMVVGPYRTMFQDMPVQGPFWVFEEVVINAFFLLDILLTFRVGYFEADPQLGTRLVIDPKLIRRRYLRSWFIVDVVATFPYGLLELAVTRGEGTTAMRGSDAAMRIPRVARMLRWMRLMRMMRVAKLKTVAQLIDELVETSAKALFLWTLLRILAMMVFVTHLAACLWYTVGKAYEGHYPDVDGGEPSSWTQRFIPDYVVDPFPKYIYAIHFSMTTMTTVGFGDIHPTNGAELAFTLGLLLMASIVFAGMLTILNGSIIELYKAAQGKRAACQELAKYMKWRALPPKLKRKVRSYFLFVWENDQEIAESEKRILQRLSSSLQADVMLHAYGNVIKSAPFFNWIFGNHDIAWKELAMQCESRFYFDGDVLFVEGQPHRNLYFLVFGSCIAKIPDYLGTNIRSLRPVRFKEPAAGKDPSDGDDAVQSTSPGGTGIEVMRSSKSTGNKSPSAKVKSKTLSKSQSSWYEVAESAEKYLNEDATSSSAMRSYKSADNSHQIDAPAFIGESCLWYEGSDAFRTSYTVICQGRCECVTLCCDGVLQTANEHPWVKNRFRAFRDAILNNVPASPSARNSCVRPVSSTSMVHQLNLAKQRRGSLDSVDYFDHFKDLNNISLNWDFEQWTVKDECIPDTPLNAKQQDASQTMHAPWKSPEDISTVAESSAESEMQLQLEERRRDKA